VSDETWDGICDSLETHPTLELLNLFAMDEGKMPPDMITSRTQAIVDMMKVGVPVVVHINVVSP
jgi:hypothetical protein